MKSTTIINTEQHLRTGLIVNPFGEDGAAHLTVLQGEGPTTLFILDAGSVRALVTALQALLPVGERPYSSWPVCIECGDPFDAEFDVDPCVCGVCSEDARA